MAKAKRRGRPPQHEITLYTLERNISEAPRKGDRASTVALKKKLLPLLDEMRPLGPKQVDSIPIDSSVRGSVRKWLSEDKHFKDRVFTISPIKDNKKVVRIFRRS